MPSKALPLILFCVLAACAVPYEKATSVTQLNERFYLITSSGNSSNKSSDVISYSLLRAGELCKEKSFVAFTSYSNKDLTRTGVYSTSSCYGTQCSGAAASVHSYTAPAGSERYYFYKSGEELPVGAIDCEKIVNELSYLKK
jgi:hypothetical protein